MNDQNDAPELLTLGLEPEDLDGHTLDELTDYLDSGRNPPNPSIDSSPGCQLALDALQRLRELSPHLLAADVAAEPEIDESWVAKILAGITLDARAGRRIPVSLAQAGADLGITEGAVRGVIRAAEKIAVGTLVGRCRLEGDVAEAGSPVTVQVEASVPFGEPIPRLIQTLRTEIATRLKKHTELNLRAIDITVNDVRMSAAAGEGTL